MRISFGFLISYACGLELRENVAQFFQNTVFVISTRKTNGTLNEKQESSMDTSTKSTNAY